jgi:DHA3 family macrolide efflux protein-like MFS transporter
VADPVTAEAEEIALAIAEVPSKRAWSLLRRPDFRKLYFAVAVSELGDALHYIALMWVALVKGGAWGVIAVRLADSLPAFVFGFHGGAAADRWNRKRMMIGADLVRAVVLIPLAAAGLLNALPLWGLVAAAFLLESATSYFAPAYGAMLPDVVDRANVQAANGLVRATADAVSIGGWAVAAGLLTFLPLSAFFAMNALSFVFSAVLLAGLSSRPARRVVAGERGNIREGFAALRPRPVLAAAVVMLGVGGTLSAGAWIGGVPEFVRSLHYGAGGFSVVMIAYAMGSVSGGLLLTRFAVVKKARAGLWAWAAQVPAYSLFAVATAFWSVLLGALAWGLAHALAVVLVNSAAQEDVPDGVLGRVMGLISSVSRGAHATGIVLVSPLFAVLLPRSVFLGSAAVTLASMLTLLAASRRASSRRGAGARR